MILVTGATGKIGGEVVRLLGEAGVPFRAFVRDAGRARVMLGDDVELIEGDLQDPARLEQALSGIETLYLLSSNSNLESGAVEASKRAGVGRIVKSSALGLGNEPPPVHRSVEELIERSSISWTHLRPSAFMQTLASYLPSLVDGRGVFRLPGGEGRTGWVDTRDIAAVAFRVLTEEGHENRAYAITGPEALSMSQVAAIVSEATGEPFRYSAVSVAEAAAAFESTELPAGMGEFLIGHYKTVARGGFDLVTDTVSVIGRTDPRSLSALVAEGAFEPITHGGR